VSRGGLRHLPEALARGAVAFVAVAAIGQVLAFGAWIVAGTGGTSPDAIARIGAIYVGAFNHVAIELDIAEVGGSTAFDGRSTALSIGIALLSVTAVGVWLLYRAGRTVAEHAGGTAVVRAVCGAAVAPAYALAVFVLALLVDVRTSLRVGSFDLGHLRVSLSAWQALAFPFAIAAFAGAAGGLASALRDADAMGRMRAVRAAISGGWRMFVLGVALSLGGLFVAGAVQADEPVAFLTPSTARYWRAVFDRPGVGLATFVHHAAVLPNEAIWTLVPAMGGCDVVRGSAEGDVVCYGRFPRSIEDPADPVADDDDVRLPVGDLGFARPPAEYLLFLLAPAVAAILGGRHAVADPEGSVRSAAAIGAASGLVFATFVAAGAVLSTVVIGYGEPSGTGDAGWIIFGPDVVAGTALAAVWGCVGGAVGAIATARARSNRAVAEKERTVGSGGGVSR